MIELDPIDRVIAALDQGLRTVFAGATASLRPSPASEHAPPEIGPEEQVESIRLMRVNHTGEVCAQALYRGQATTARSPEVRGHLHQAAAEEGDHLAWCEQRIGELGGRTSRLNPLFYTGSFLIGVANGLLGDRWSMGFVQETEQQVTRHLDGHLDRISSADTRSRAIIEQMRNDEQRHATAAAARGATTLPAPVQSVMKLASRVMTGTTYWI